MTANGDSASADKEAPNGEASRRQFLGAAAAASSLPLVDGGAGGESEENPLAPTQDGYNESEYGSETVSESAGHLELWVPESEPVEVSVQSAVECVGLKLTADTGHIEASMLPEDVDKLIKELRRAQAKTVEEEVAWARETWEEHQK